MIFRILRDWTCRCGQTNNNNSSICSRCGNTG